MTAKRGNPRTMMTEPNIDRRVSRTRDTLGNALFLLMREKKFDEITVQELLDRAGVGRSTFYVHYKDKEDLLLSDVELFLEWFATALKRQGASTRRLVPVKELFGHVRDAHDLYTALVRSDKANDVRVLAQGFFARSIEERLQVAGMSFEPAQRSAQAFVLAGGFWCLLDWWIDQNMKADPQEMDDLFHRMAWSGLATSDAAGATSVPEISGRSALG